MGFDIVGARSDFPVGTYWWVTIADYCHQVAPRISASCSQWYTNDGDGLKADQARELAAILQGSIDECRIDDYARGLSSGLSNVQLREAVEDSLNVELFGGHNLARHEQERKFSNEFVSQVQRFIAFLFASNGFEIL
jgi:hypothetical protein